MPNKSERQQTLEDLETFVLAEHIINLIFDDSDDDDDDEDNNNTLLPLDLDDLDDKIDAIIEKDYGIALMDDDDDEEDSFDVGAIDGMSIAETMYTFVSSMRYMADRDRQPVIDYMNEVLMKLPNEKWKEDTRMTRDAFEHIVELIKSDPVFQNDSNNKQAPVEIQLAVALYRFGTYGNGASVAQVAKKFGIGAGTTELYTNRVIRALVRLYPSRMQ